MKTIEALLEPITGYLISITRNTKEGWYEMEIGIYKGWVVSDNDSVACEVISESENGKLIRIAPKNDTVVIDDLVNFVMIVIDTNRKIAEKEKEFTNKMSEMKKTLEEQAKKFYEELDALKDNSFKNIGENFAKTLQEEDGGEKKRGRPRKEAGNVQSTEKAENTQ